MRSPRLEILLLATLAQRPLGAALGELRDAFSGEPVTHTLEHLADRGQVNRYPGSVYGIAPLGRSRIASVVTS